MRHQFICQLLDVHVAKSRATFALGSITSLDGGHLSNLNGKKVILTIEDAPASPNDLAREALQLATKGDLETARAKALEAVNAAYEHRPTEG
jgi:hypothetical protein